MKLIFAMLFSLLLTPALAQKVNFSITGNWQNTEYHGNDGATDYVNRLTNGQIYIFENEAVVRDSANNIGSYRLNGDSLQITFNEKTRYYRIFYQKKDADTLALVPVSEKYQFICDEGCSEIFVRRNSLHRPGLRAIKQDE